MATLEIYYEDGRYESFSSTILSFQEDQIIENERIFLDLETMKEKGILWERDFFTYANGEEDQGGRTIETTQIIKPEELEFVGLISLNGKTYYARIDGELKFVFFGVEEEEETSEEEMLAEIAEMESD